ncbi:MAG: hypothetical protein IMW97_08715 [Firmicutes bacterium]|nr:hypothetical protein [Candidatus Fermentithermobacillaceae bacterium]
MDRSTSAETPKKTGEVRSTNKTGRGRPGLGRTNRKKSIIREKVRSALNPESSLYNDEIPDPDSPELPDESYRREDYR